MTESPGSAKVKGHALWPAAPRSPRACVLLIQGRCGRQQRGGCAPACNLLQLPVFSRAGPASPESWGNQGGTSPGGRGRGRDCSRGTDLTVIFEAQSLQVSLLGPIP